MDSSTRYKQNPSVVFTELDGDVALFHSDTCDYLVLNETGSSIWAALASQPTLPELCDIMQRDYSVSREDCIADLDAWLKAALEKNVVMAIQSA